MIFFFDVYDLRIKMLSFGRARTGAFLNIIFNMHTIRQRGGFLVGQMQTCTDVIFIRYWYYITGVLASQATSCCWINFISFNGVCKHQKEMVSLCGKIQALLRNTSFYSLGEVGTRAEPPQNLPTAAEVVQTVLLLEWNRVKFAFLEWMWYNFYSTDRQIESWCRWKWMKRENTYAQCRKQDSK